MIQAYINLMASDARAGGDLLEQWDTDQECVHGRLPFDHTPDCGCWPTLQVAVVIPLRRTRTRVMPEAERRLEWLREARSRGGMTTNKENEMPGTDDRAVGDRGSVDDQSMVATGQKDPPEAKG